MRGSTAKRTGSKIMPCTLHLWRLRIAWFEPVGECFHPADSEVSFAHAAASSHTDLLGQENTCDL